jgi:hypothetical protein
MPIFAAAAREPKICFEHIDPIFYEHFFVISSLTASAQAVCAWLQCPFLPSSSPSCLIKLFLIIAPALLLSAPPHHDSIMPPLVPAYTWQQDEHTIDVSIPLKNNKASAIDIYGKSACCFGSHAPVTLSCRSHAPPPPLTVSSSLFLPSGTHVRQG